MAVLRSRRRIGRTLKHAWSVFQMTNAEQTLAIKGWRVTALRNRCAEAPEGSVFLDKNSPCYKLFPSGSRLL
jgi:hypothetical protein